MELWFGIGLKPGFVLGWAGTNQFPILKPAQARRRSVGYVFVWFKIAKLYDVITLAVIGICRQSKEFCNVLEEENRMIERFNVTNHHHHFRSPLYLTSLIHRYISLLQLPATNNRYIPPL